MTPRPIVLALLVGTACEREAAPSRRQAQLSAAVIRGPYLQMASPNSVVVRWRTAAPTDSRVGFGPSPTFRSGGAENRTSTTEHEVRVGGLAPGGRYYYTIGSSSGELAGGDDYFFVTPPVPGEPRPIRAWVLGDPGTGTPGQAAVRDAYQRFTADRATDLMILLGDNAYYSGTDEEYQRGFFDVYPTFLRQVPLWPAIGNHDTAQSTDPLPTIPYFEIFSVPTRAEVGGVASGTEKYYSFDHGNVHFVCLDSMSSSRALDGAMFTWLRTDLATNVRPWLVAYWHHPPYSRGSHNSDLERELIEMRENALPILEVHGVDLVLAGHSHDYERSFLIDGHYGDSTTFTDRMKKNGGAGKLESGGAYAKAIAGPVGHTGTVYVVAGSAGQTSGGTLDHPAMFVSLNRLGSLVLDFDGGRLDAWFVTDTGSLDDGFTMVKGVPPPAPRDAGADRPTTDATPDEARAPDAPADAAPPAPDAPEDLLVARDAVVERISQDAPEAIDAAPDAPAPDAATSSLDAAAATLARDSAADVAATPDAADDERRPPDEGGAQDARTPVVGPASGCGCRIDAGRGAGGGAWLLVAALAWCSRLGRRRPLRRAGRG